jgi:hypothetical protein
VYPRSGHQLLNGNYLLRGSVSGMDGRTGRVAAFAAGTDWDDLEAVLTP